MAKPLAKAVFLGAILLAGWTLPGNAQSYYGQDYPSYRTPPTPPLWSYDPYTSGQAPCPQGIPGDTQTCQQKMPPTYGQPNFWPSRQ